MPAKVRRALRGIREGVSCIGVEERGASNSSSEKLRSCGVEGRSGDILARVDSRAPSMSISIAFIDGLPGGRGDGARGPAGRREWNDSVRPFLEDFCTGLGVFDRDTWWVAAETRLSVSLS